MTVHSENDQVTTQLPCCLTGSQDAVVVATRDRDGKPLRTVIAVESGLVFTDPRPTAGEIRQFYAEDYRRQYKRVAQPRMKHVLRAGRLAKRRLAAIGDRLGPGARVLDAGSGGGEFVHALRHAGYDATGVEPNRGYAEFAKQAYGLKVFNGFYQDAPFEQGEFDAITLFHVLEHLEQPVEALRLLAGWLKPGGTLALEVPCVDSTETAPNQKWHLGHLYNFSGPTLTAAAVLAGLEPVRVEAAANVFGVFEKPASGAPATTLADVLSGAFDDTFGVLTRHTLVSHYLKPHVPALRLLGKATRLADESSIVRRYADVGPAALLDDLARGKVA